MSRHQNDWFFRFVSKTLRHSLSILFFPSVEDFSREKHTAWRKVVQHLELSRRATNPLFLLLFLSLSLLFLPQNFFSQYIVQIDRAMNGLRVANTELCRAYTRMYVAVFNVDWREVSGLLFSRGARGKLFRSARGTAGVETSRRGPRRWGSKRWGTDGCFKLPPLYTTIYCIPCFHSACSCVQRWGLLLYVRFFLFFNNLFCMLRMYIYIYIKIKKYKKRNL